MNEMRQVNKNHDESQIQVMDWRKQSDILFFQDIHDLILIADIQMVGRLIQNNIAAFLHQYAGQ